MNLDSKNSAKNIINNVMFFIFLVKKIDLLKSLKLGNTKKQTSFILIKGFAVERGPKHFFSNHENDGTFEFFSSIHTEQCFFMF